MHPLDRLLYNCVDSLFHELRLWQLTRLRCYQIVVVTQRQLVHIDLPRPSCYAFLHQLLWEAIGPVKGKRHATSDLSS